MVVAEWLARRLHSIRLCLLPPRRQPDLPVNYRGFLHTTPAWEAVGGESVTMKALLVMVATNGVGQDVLVSGLTVGNKHSSSSRGSYGSTVCVLGERLGERGK